MHNLVEKQIVGKFTYKMFKNTIYKISTLEGTYILKNDNYTQTVKHFEEVSGINYSKFDIIANPELKQYVHEAVHYNSCVDFDRVHNQQFIHLDITKAYTQGKSCSFYCGYLGKITQFSKLQFNSSDLDKLPIGLYTITNIDIMNSPLRLLNNKLNIYSNLLTYPLPELKFLSSVNITFDIIAGAYGSQIDFEFTPEMINGTDSEGIPYYSKYIGSLDSLTTHDSSFF